MKPSLEDRAAADTKPRRPCGDRATTGTGRVLGGVGFGGAVAPGVTMTQRLSSWIAPRWLCPAWAAVTASLLGALLLSTGCRAPSAKPTGPGDGSASSGVRLVALADLHGDTSQTLAALRMPD